MNEVHDARELDALRQRKEKLLLEQEIASLERKQKLGKVGEWKWLWVAPVAALGAFVAFVGLDNRDPAQMGLGLVGLVPLVLKFCFRR